MLEIRQQFGCLFHRCCQSLLDTPDLCLGEAEIKREVDDFDQLMDHRECFLLTFETWVETDERVRMDLGIAEGQVSNIIADKDRNDIRTELDFRRQLSHRVLRLGWSDGLGLAKGGKGDREGEGLFSPPPPYPPYSPPFPPPPVVQGPDKMGSDFPFYWDVVTVD